MSAHEREDFLFSLLDGSLDPASEEARKAFAADPSLAAELEEMKRISHVLDSGAEFEREVVSESAGEPTRAEIDAVLSGLAGGQSPSSSAVSASGIPAGWWMAAAAVLLVLLGLYQVFGVGDTVNHGPEYLGNAMNIRPVGELDQYGTFEWTFEESQGVWFRIDVYSDVPPNRGERIDFVERQEETSWTPENPEAWPDKIVVTVAAYDATGSDLDTSLVECWRSQP